MKKEEMMKAINAMTKNGAFTKTVGTMFTADAKDADAIAKKTTKTAVKELTRLFPACLICCFLL